MRRCGGRGTDGCCGCTRGCGCIRGCGCDYDGRGGGDGGGGESEIGTANGTATTICEKKHKKVQMLECKTHDSTSHNHQAASQPPSSVTTPLNRP